jgi:hypothetical protein
MRILIACEESDEVRGRFEALGFDAWSCDLQPNRNPKAKHYQGDVFDIINNNWDAMIAFPPCTHLAVSGAAWFEEKRKDGRQQQGIDFFTAMCQAPIKHKAIENPIGIMSNLYRKPDQIIHPYYFGDSASKATCLWLYNLPKLKHYPQDDLFNKQTWVETETITTSTGMTHDAWWYKTSLAPQAERSKLRSKTFPGIAEAMATQWSEYLKSTL